MSDKQIIRAGTESTNIQGKEVTVHQHNGLNYTDVKEIAMDVFKNNFYQLSEEAANVAKQRAEDFTERFLNKLKAQGEFLLNSMKDPDIQYGLFTAQKSYARTGDENISELLLDTLIERTKAEERTTYQLVLNECISVLPKLTIEQLDILSLDFILMNTSRRMQVNKENVIDYFKSNIILFTEQISKNKTNFKHLIYAGCCSTTTGGYLLERVLIGTYPGIFMKGFTLKEFQEITNESNNLKLITPHLIEDGKYQLISSNSNGLEELFDLYQTEEMVRLGISDLQNRYQMSDNEVRPFMINLIPEMSNFFDLWDNTLLNEMNLTSVGTCLAILNLKSKGFKGFNLDKFLD